MVVWERVYCTAAASGGRYREGLEEAGQAGLSAGHRHLPGIGEQTLESGSKPSAWCMSMGKWGVSCTAPLPGPQPGRACRWKARGSGWLLIIPLGEGQVGSSKDSSCYRLSHITRGCQSLQKSFGMSWRRAGTAAPSPSAGFPGEVMAGGHERLSPL